MKFIKEINIKPYVYLATLLALSACGGGSDDYPVTVPPPIGAVQPGDGSVNPPVIPPITIPPDGGTPTPPPTDPIVPTDPNAPPPTNPPTTGSTSGDYSWLGNDEPIVIAQADNSEILTAQARTELSVEEMRQKVYQEMEAERVAMEEYHKKRIEEMNKLESDSRAIKTKLQENVTLTWLGTKDNLTVKTFDQLKAPGVEALPCDYAHMAFIKDEKLGTVNVGEVIDWSITSKPENNYNGWFFVLSPFVYSDSMTYFKGKREETHLLWARRISDKELVVKPAGNPWDSIEQFRSSNGYSNVRVSYDGVALPVLLLESMSLTPMEQATDLTCPK